MNNSAKKNERKASYAAIAATFLFAVLLVCLLWFCGLYRPFPPPPEYGIEVNLGYSEYGTGDRQTLDPVAGPVTEEPLPAASDEEEVVTAQEEDAPAMPQVSEKPRNRVAENRMEEKPEKVEEKPKEQEINPLALYPGKRKGTDNSSQGETDKPGDQGKPAGDINASGYSGPGGSGGISFSLNGRTLMSLVKPAYDSEEVGVVVVRIWVNRSGTVTRAQAGVKGTTTLDKNLWQTAERAAMQSKFVPKENAPEEQVGTISYRFVRGF